VSEGFVEANGLRLHVVEWGQQQQSLGTRAIVLTHGLGSSAHIWDLAGPLIADRMPLTRVVALDQRGHGESEQPDAGYDFPSVVADLVGCLDGLGLTEPSVLVGHSWGASVVLHFAVTHPDRTAGIALVDGGTSSPGERWSWPETEARLTPPSLDGMLWSDLRARMSRNNGAYADPRAEAVGRSLFQVDEQGRVTRRFQIPNHMQVVRALWEQRPTELLAQVRCPVLILPARQASDASDRVDAKLAGVQRAQELLQKHDVRVRARWFEDTVHDVPLQRPSELASELADFASEVLLPSRARS
jgi:pimeloyl-ACP methyl ester carboxylesterase